MKKKRNLGTLPLNKQIAPRDFRGKEHKIRKQSNAKAPDGISGDWGG